MAEFNLNRFRYNYQGEWQTGTSYNRDDIVSVEGQSYVCLVGHTASTNFTDDLNAVLPGSLPPVPQPRWVLMTRGVAFKGVWQPNVEYLVGNLSYYKGTVYICNIAHKSSIFANDKLNWGFFARHIEFFGAWNSFTNYGYGSLVKYGGIIYKCVESHQSDLLLEDDKEKWIVFYDGVIYRGNWFPSSDYFINEIVKYGSSLFRVTQTHTSTSNFAPDKFALEFPGFSFEGTWNSNTVYQLGDIVRYGGILYFSLGVNQDSDPSRSADDSTLDWIVLSESYNFRGVYNQNGIYKTGDVVQRGGQLYEAVQDIGINDGDGSSLDYLDSDWWELLIPGSAWARQWTTNNFYSVGDVVYYLGSSYKANIEHLSDNNNFPGDNGNVFEYWDLVVKGGQPAGLEQQGDLLTYGLSRSLTGDGSTEGLINVPIGEQDKILSVTDELDIFWRYRQEESDTVFVASWGADDEGFDKGRGLSKHKPFRTVSFACQYVEDQFKPLSPVTIRVETGDYAEVAPIIIPAGCAVVGDELRSTTILPSEAKADYQNDFQFVKEYLNYLPSFLLNVLQNIEITPTVGNNEPQRLNTEIADVQSVNDILLQIDEYLNYLDNELNGTSFTVTKAGSNNPNVNTSQIKAVQSLFQNRRFISAELFAYISKQHPGLTFSKQKFQRDIFALIRGIKRDFEFSGNYATLLAADRYVNAVNGSERKNLLLFRDTTGLRNCTLKGMKGELEPVNANYKYRKPTGGAYTSLDPGWGPADDRTWIINRSPYIQGVTTLGTGCVGKRINGLLHNGGNRSMVSNDFTQVLSDGIGVWASNGARTECVSVFTYYNTVGYLADTGGIIRATNGNNSYGRYGIVADGVDPAESPKQLSVFNRNNEALVADGFAGGITDEIKILEYQNAGQEYTQANADVSGAGDFAEVEYSDFRDEALFEGRIINTAGSGNPGGTGYLVEQGFAQITNNAESRILLSANDPKQIDTDYINARLIIISGSGTGQYGIINAYDPITKEASIIKESTGQPGWDNVIQGTPIEPSLDSTAQYRIEPYVSFSEPPFTSRSVASPASTEFVKTVFGSTSNNFNNIILPKGSNTLTDLPNLNAKVNIERQNKVYNLTLIDGGSGYAVGDTLVILGSDLDGQTPQNDIEVTVTEITDDSTDSILSFEFAGTGRSGRFISIDKQNIAYYSDDGENWQSILLPAISNNYTDISAAENKFIAIAGGENIVSISTDGSTWSPILLPVRENWSSITYGKNTWVVVSDNSNTVLYSNDGGNTWQETSIPEDTVSDSTADSTVPAYAHVDYGRGIFVAVSTGDLASAVSNDGVNWIRVDSALPELEGNLAYDLIDLVYGDNRFLAVSIEGFSFYSFDGEKWFQGEQITNDINFDVTDLVYNQGIFVACLQGKESRLSNEIVFTESGLNWQTKTLSNTASWSSIAYGYADGKYKWIILADNTAANGLNVVSVGRQAKVRADVRNGSFDIIKIWDPGSGYTITTDLSFTVADATFVTAVEIDHRLGNGVLAQPDFINRGSGYRTDSSEIIITGDGFADIIPENDSVVCQGVTIIPGPGAQLRFNGIFDPEADNQNTLLTFTVRGATDLGEDSTGNGTRLVKFLLNPSLENEYNLTHLTPVSLQTKFSQARVTFHDFLDIGAGNAKDTNYPDIYARGSFFFVSPDKETLEENGGRVFFVSTDQSGNFKAGDLFAVEQDTGVITISAEFFDLGGLSELALGGIRLGGSGAVVREFSTDPTFAADSDNIIPTQRAIATFLADRLSVGGQDIETNELIAGRVQIGTAQDIISTTSGEYLRITSDVNHFENDSLGNSNGVAGTMISQQIFLGIDKSDSMQ